MESGFMLLLFGPALLGLTTLFVGIHLLRKPPGQRANTTVRTVLAVLCLLFTLGVGACYGLLILG